MLDRRIYIAVLAVLTATSGCAKHLPENAKKDCSCCAKKQEAKHSYYSNDFGVYLPKPEDVRYQNIRLLKVPPRDANGVHYIGGERPYLIASRPIKKVRPVALPWRVSFDFNSYKVTSSQYGVIQALVNAMNANPSLRIALVGYADAVGEKEYNDKLSRKRAEAVKKALIANGLKNPEQIVLVEGAGESNHLSNHDSTQSAAANRRVDAFVVRGG